MRKFLPWLILVLVLICTPAMAETYVFDQLYASMEVPDTYIVLMESNLAEYADWLEAQGSSMEEKQSDFTRRGVLLQAWTREMDACFELRARQDENTLLIFDVNEQSSDVRGQYRTGHYPHNNYPGYDFSTSEWKNTEEGRFLVLRYTRRDNGEVLYKGFMRRTIRNGYEIDFDLQIYNRAVTNKDNTSLNKIWETFHFIELLELPPAASAKINIEDAPPTETNDKKFSIAGTAAEGVKFTTVTMGLSYPDPIVSDVVVGENGKFSIPITLPREGVFLITLTAEYQDQEILELAYPVTYQSSLLTVNFTNKPEGFVMEDEVKISGTGEPGATIQVFVNGENKFSKRVTMEGKFAIPIETKEEGAYDVSLVFSKKDLADRRFNISFTRKWNDADTMKYLSKQSISPTYAQLKKNMQNYEGRIMGYRAYITDVAESGDEYIVSMALAKTDGKYSNPVLVTTDEKPGFAVGERVMMYGTCEGMSLGTGAEAEGETEESYPCFALLLFASLD